MTKGEQTRRRIVEAAAPIFNEHGYEGASLNELMAAITRGMPPEKSGSSIWMKKRTASKS
jgi:AcrR family transcriptional regulator